MDDRLDTAQLQEMRAHALMAHGSGFTRVEIDPLHLAEILGRLIAAKDQAWTEMLAAKWVAQAAKGRAMHKHPGECTPDCISEVWMLESCAAELRARANGGEP
jgi:hypothetical protein